MPADLLELVDKALSSQISRVVTLLTPLLAGVLGVALYWVQDAIGIDLQVDPAVAASFIGTIVLGAALTGLKWLPGRASFEKAALEMATLHHAGQAQAASDADPSVPPGLVN